MTTCCPQPKGDLVANKKHYGLVWGVPVLLLVVSWPVPMPLWLRGLIWSAVLAWMSGACLWNARNCGRMHCFFTGPFFLLMSLVSLGAGFNWIPLYGIGFGSLGLILLIGTPVLHLLPELRWGTYRKG